MSKIKSPQSGMAIANTAIATSRKFKGQGGEQKEEVCFTDVTFFGRSAEVANQYLRKGSKVLVEGRLKFDQWTDQNGQKRSKHSVSVDSMQMLDSKKDTESYSVPNTQESTPKNTYVGSQQNQANTTYPEPIPEISLNEEDLPF